MTTRDELLRRATTFLYDEDHAVQPFGEELFGLFQAMRPDGDGLEDMLGDLHHGEDLIARLREVFAVAGNPLTPEGHERGYFIVTEPALLPLADAKRVALDHYRKMGAVLREFQEWTDSEDIVETVERISALTEVGVANEYPPRSPTLWGPGDVIGDALGEYMADPDPPHPAEILREAYYSIACSFLLRWHLMWPIYSEVLDEPEPFAPFFRLWKAGYDVSWHDSERPLLVLSEACTTSS